MTEISDHIIDVDTITNTVEKRRTCVWYEPFENFYDGILQVANMQSFFKEHSAGFHTAEAKSIWKEYTESYYQMDTYYRLFHLSFQKSLETSNILLDDLFKHVVDKVEGLYTHWFLGELGNNWSDVCADELATYGKVLEVPQQEDFYRSRIQTSDTKVFVIISDAMRYEVAVTMADQLQRETQSKVSISSMQSIFPSTTKFGMAALLPHKELTVEVRNDILTVLADGQSTASTYRDKVLKTEESASVALKYNDIIAMKRAERSALVKGIKKLHEVGCNMTLVGDPRQTTYRTHYEAKYKKYAGGKIVIFVQDNIAGMNIDTTTLSTSHRNNQIICDLANQMYPDMKPCDSAMNEKTGHDGIFWVHENDIDKYVDIYNPVQLRYDKRTKVNPIPKTMNFGLSKGLTFNRVLIYPTKPMLDWLSGKSKDMKDESLSKFYVAVTRARYSVAFVYKTKRLPTNDIGTRWTPDVLE